jgi:hypothetical protein
MTGFRYTPQAVELIRRHARTMTPATIAAFMHCPIDMVEMICRKHEIRYGDGLGAPDIEAPLKAKGVKKALEIQVDETLLRVVKRQARQRGVVTHTLIEQLIERIAEDELFGAVLDR